MVLQIHQMERLSRYSLIINNRLLRFFSGLISSSSAKVLFIVVSVKCNGKTVKQAYHTICTDCSSALKICSKCGKSDGSITFGTTENQEDINQQFIDALKNVRERERRALLRLTQSNKKPIESGNINADEEFHLNSLNKLIVKELSDIKFDEDKYESDDYKSS
ncbi:unnamed protein product [Schistosoma guineensis]|nr:unnamed protein product [Schistosoma guineensis]